MIRICITIEERNGTTSSVASASDSDATPAEKHLLETIAVSFGREKNPIHLHAESLAQKYRAAKKSTLP